MVNKQHYLDFFRQSLTILPPPFLRVLVGCGVESTINYVGRRKLAFLQASFLQEENTIVW
jgi:hypothetical protein